MLLVRRGEAAEDKTMYIWKSYIKMNGNKYFMDIYAYMVDRPGQGCNEGGIQINFGAAAQEASLSEGCQVFSECLRVYV